ncbi:MAG: FAD-dependent oxidoreductase, partial [Acidimicrobiales bacterium]|nr:FAD-dependent oxidoreductase [Acidimicrobiales bacterium]
MNHRWGIVGGGMMGMALGLWLADRGERVTLIEGADHLGGLAAPWRIGDVTWDRHYHVILNSDSHVLALLERLGLTDEIRWVETRTGVLADGQLHSVSNVVEYLKYPGLSMIDKLRMGWTILYGSRLRDWRALERTSVESWLRRHSGDRAFEKFWLPLLRSKLGDNYERTSAAFIWTTIQRLYAARRSGLKKEMFGYVSGGYDRIIDELEKALITSGVEIHTGEKVGSVTATEAGVQVTTDTMEETFDRVVLTTAPPLTARLVPGLDDDERARMTGVEYQGIVCASLLLDRPLGGFYVTNITDPAPFTG